MCVTDTRTFSLTDSQVRGNSVGAAGHGAGVHFYGATASMDNVLLSGNRTGTDGLGGGLYVQGGKVTLTNLTAEGNSGVRDGGGIYSQDAVLNMTEATIRGNDATGCAGIIAMGGILNMLRVTVGDHDSGLGDGAGVTCGNCAGTWQEVTVSGNRARTYGGGLMAAGAH